MNATDLLHRIAGAWRADPVDEPTSRRVLDAAAHQLELFGIQRTTMDDVAKRAGVSRVTIYRRYATKDALVEAVVLDQVRAFLTGLAAHVAQFDSDEDQMVEGVTWIAAELRGHTLLQRLLEREPDLLLPQLTTESGPLIAMARELIVEYAAVRFPTLPRSDAALAAELGVRLIISLVLAPDGVIDLDDGERVRQVLRAAMRPGLLSRPTSHGRNQPR